MNYFPQLLKGLSDMTPSRHLGLLMRRLFCCYSDHRLMTFRPVTLAMTVICLELEQMTPNWLSMVIMVQQMAKVFIYTSHGNTCLEIMEMETINKGRIYK